MSLHNLATVFGPTLLRPSEVESKAHLTSAADIWSHDVMAQVRGRGQLPERTSENSWAHTPSLLSSWARGLQAVPREAGLWTVLPSQTKTKSLYSGPRPGPGVGFRPGRACLRKEAGAGNAGASSSRGKLWDCFWAGFLGVLQDPEQGPV